MTMNSRGTGCHINVHNASGRFEEAFNCMANTNAFLSLGVMTFQTQICQQFSPLCSSSCGWLLHIPSPVLFEVYASADDASIAAVFPI